MSIVRNVWEGVKLGDIAEWLEDVGGPVPPKALQ